jgi:hypothetical protein
VVPQLNVQVFRDALAHHPDTVFTTRVINMLTFGADIGYTGPRAPRVCPNWASVTEHLPAVEEIIDRDVRLGRKVGPFSTPPFDTYVASPLGAFTKKASSKVRVIHDLSWPPDHSINHHIDTKTYTVKYMAVDDLAAQILTLGRHALVAKLDLQDAYKLVNVRPQDWDLLGVTMYSHGKLRYYVDVTLPFGLCSAPALFNDVADALAFMMRERGVTYTDHYLDDFVTTGPPNSPECNTNLDTMLQVCSDTKFPVNPAKVVRAATTMEFLGIVVDTDLLELRISEDRLRDITAEIQSAHTNRRLTKRQLLSVLGKLVFISRVVHQGRTFLRRLFTVSTRVKQLSHHVTIDDDAAQDLQWWVVYLPNWNGISMMYDPHWEEDTSLRLTTDASDTGYGITYQLDWCWGTWTGPLSFLRDCIIAYKELFAVLVAIATFGARMSGTRLVLHCDNQVVVYSINGHTSRSPALMQMVRALYYICAHHQVDLRSQYITSLDNDVADALSRQDLRRFRALSPTAAEGPTPPAPVTHIIAMC